MAPTLLIGFPKKPRPFMDKGHSINSAMTTSECFKNATGELRDCITQLAPLLDKLNVACNDADGRDVNKIAYRNLVQEEVKAHLIKMAKLVEVFAAGDLKILESSGYGIKRSSSKKIHYPLLPTYLVLSRGKKSGEMDGRGKPLPGAWSFEVHFTDGDPTVEANWRPYGIYRSCGHLRFVGLTAGTTYSFRIRGIWDNGTGPWSPPSTLMST